MTATPPTCRYDLRGIEDRSGRRWLSPLLDRRQRAITVGFFVLWAGLAIRFVLWWLRPEHRADWFGLIATSAVIGFTLLLPLWLFFTALNARLPRRPGEADGLDRVAMIVTKAPAEPWPLVRRTIEAMLDQDHPHDYDVWLADEHPSDETLHWCAANGVRVSSRHDIADYHQPDWPRRTKSKEGNLAFFYDHWGYREYDIVCQFDADHVPRRNYLSTILRGFANPRVGYVATPSVCSAGSEGSWTSRGRLHKEAPLHGLLQAGHNAGFGPTCVGSHYAVRTRALREIGGIGPELAEDFSTSFLLAAHGWVGVFDIDVHAEGEGPMTFVDGMTQELQWARSLTTVALRYSRGHWRHLTRTERFRFGFIQLWYPLFVGHLVLGSLLAPIAVITARPWMEVSFVAFYTRAAMPTMAVVAFMIWVRRQGVLRPNDAPVLSWESSLFNLTRWPWNALGIVQAVLGAIRGKTYNFRVTPKEQGGHRPLPWTALAPTAALAVLQSLVVLVAGGNRGALGYVMITTIGAVVYAVATVAVIGLHLYENPATSFQRIVNANRGAISVAIIALGAAVAATSRAVEILVTLERNDAVRRVLGLDDMGSTAAGAYVVGLLALASYALFARADRVRDESTHAAEESTEEESIETQSALTASVGATSAEASSVDQRLTSIDSSREAHPTGRGHRPQIVFTAVNDRGAHTVGV